MSTSARTLACAASLMPFSGHRIPSQKESFMSNNTIILCGRVGQDVELRKTPKGKTVGFGIRWPAVR